MEIDKIVWEYGGPGTVLIRHKQTQDIHLTVDFMDDCLVVPDNCIPTKLPIDLLRQFVDNYETAKADHLKSEEPPF
tara:strand:+ start:1851 stop:2078 length:228 start_codon:yes stop_codon:yes gene_type:complete